MKVQFVLNVPQTLALFRSLFQVQPQPLFVLRRFQRPQCADIHVDGVEEVEEEPPAPPQGERP